MTTQAQDKKVKLNPITEKWTGFLDHKSEEVQVIEGKKQRDVMAQLFENQEKDIRENSDYADSQLVKAFGQTLNEAVVDGDHGYNPTNIAAGQTTGAVTNIGPAVMGLVRRTLPKMVAFDIAGVQPMQQSTGQYFALRSVYGKNPLDENAKEAFHPMYAPDSMYSGKGSHTKFEKIEGGKELKEGEVYLHDNTETGRGYFQAVETVTVDAATDEFELDTAVNKLIEASSIAEIAEGMATSIAELQESFNDSSDNPWNEMSFRIDKQTIEARSRQLKASYSIELAQDLRAVHGMDADAELSGILASEILLEIDREVFDWINYSAQVGKTGFTQTAGTKAGVFDFQDPIDTKGARWQGEAFKSFLFQIDKEATEVGRQTGRGPANFIIASRNVVNVLASIDERITTAVAGSTTGLNTDTTKALFAGVLAGKYAIYIDQYARQDYFTVGYKGANAMDAGIFYAPYVPLQPLKGSDPKNFQPVLGFKTRYAVGVNPFANSRLQVPKAKITSGMVTLEASQGKNAYFRRVFVKGI